MAQQLTTLAALPEVRVLTPSTHMGVHDYLQLSPRDQWPPLQALNTQMAHRHMCRQNTHICTFKN